MQCVIFTVLSFAIVVWYLCCWLALQRMNVEVYRLQNWERTHLENMCFPICTHFHFCHVRKNTNISDFIIVYVSDNSLLARKGKDYVRHLHSFVSLLRVRCLSLVSMWLTSFGRIVNLVSSKCPCSSCRHVVRGRRLPAC